MGIFKTIKGLKATKDVVEVAKLEFEKEKIKQENKKKEESDKAAYQLGIYAKENGEIYVSVIEQLLNETNELIDEINNLKENGIKLADRSNFTKMKNQATENLQYLYLAKECMSLLEKASTGIKLTDQQNQFINKFSPFFDGRKVLSDELKENKENKSLWGDIKEGFKDIKEEFIPNKKSNKFSFDELLKTYEDRISSLKVPDFDALFKKFKNNYKKMECQNNAPTSSETIVCSKCLFVAPAGSKFCPSCGSQFIKEKYCPNCGKKINPGSKFCANCGTKVE